MSLSAALILAAAATAAAPAGDRPRGLELAQATVVARILPAAVVRQASGPERVADTAPQPRLSRRGRIVLVEFE